jgi:hypothetical protein
MAGGLVPFQVLTRLGDAAHGELAIALGAEFEDVDEVALDAALAPIVADLVVLADADPAEQLLGAEAIFGRHLRAESGPERELGIGDLLPHEVARRRRGDELPVALVALEAARRAGLELGLVACPDAVFLAHAELDVPVLLALTPEWRLVDARELEDPELAWQCAHEAVSLLLELLLDRTRETGNIGAELLAAELCLALPVEDDEQERLQTQLASVRARLN